MLYLNYLEVQTFYYMLDTDNAVMITVAARRGRLKESLGAPSVNTDNGVMSVGGIGTRRRLLGRVLLAVSHQCSSTLSVYVCVCIYTN